MLVDVTVTLSSSELHPHVAMYPPDDPALKHDPVVIGPTVTAEPPQVVEEVYSDTVAEDEEESHDALSETPLVVSINAHSPAGTEIDNSGEPEQSVLA